MADRTGKAADYLVETIKLNVTLAIGAIGLAAVFIRLFEGSAVAPVLGVIAILVLFASMAAGLSALSRIINAMLLPDEANASEIFKLPDIIRSRTVRARLRFQSWLLFAGVMLVVLSAFGTVKT